MKVYKFGGASVKDADAIRNIVSILSNDSENKVVVVSALDKTTNKLEVLHKMYMSSDKNLYNQFNDIKDFHLNIIKELFAECCSEVNLLIEEIFNHLNEKLSEEPNSNYDYEYDQIVSFGELLSTRIISSYLNMCKIKNLWVDIRNVIKTDDNYCQAEIDYDLSKGLAHQKLNFTGVNTYITQGFIASTTFGTTTTLGREGSDYTASVIASLIGADSVTIWKDVPGILNADPKKFTNTHVLPKISYKEAVELAYSGAKVIHPKTIKPLHNANINLYVKSFIDPSVTGTVITHTDTKIVSPVLIVKDDQILLSVSPKDISFVIDDRLNELISILDKYKVKANMIQSSAVNFSVCIDTTYNVHDLITELSDMYNVKYNDNLVLLTVRYYTDDILQRELKDKIIFMEQRTRSIARFVIR